MCPHHSSIHLFVFTNSFTPAVNILSAYYAPGAVLGAGRDTKMSKIRFLLSDCLFSQPPGLL